MFFKGLSLTIRLNHQTISFKDIITGGWALKFQASFVNKYNSYLFLFVDRASRRRAQSWRSWRRRFLICSLKYDSIKYQTNAQLSVETIEKERVIKYELGHAPRYTKRCQRLGRGFNSLLPLHF